MSEDNVDNLLGIWIIFITDPVMDFLAEFLGAAIEPIVELQFVGVGVVPDEFALYTFKTNGEVLIRTRRRSKQEYM